MKIILNPEQGMTIDGKEILLGMTRAEVIKLMGEPESENPDEAFPQIFYFDNALFFEFDAGTDKLEYIELEAGSEEVQPELFGKPVFSEDADAFAEFLIGKNIGAFTESEENCRYLFHSGIHLWRRNSWEKFKKTAPDLDISEDDDLPDVEIIDDTLQELNETKHWQTVGIGTKQYIADMEAMTAKKSAITLLPTEGADIDGKEIRLGMTHAEVLALMGKPEAEHADKEHIETYYAESCIHFEFNAKTSILTYIEFSNGTDAVQPELFGVSVFPMEADDLFNFLNDRNDGGVIDDEDGYSYVFEALGISIWRERIPEDVEEMIEEAKADGNPMSEEDSAEEWKLANYWATIGVGGTEYLKSVESY